MKKVYLLSVVVVLLLLLTACYTTVSINSLAPSQINLGADQVIAIAKSSVDSPVRFTRHTPLFADLGAPIPNQLKNYGHGGNGNGTAEAAARYLTDALYESLSEGVYRIISPEETRRYIKSSTYKKSQADALSSTGATLILYSWIDHAECNEYISATSHKNKEGKTYYKYYLNQHAYLTISYELVDVKTGRVVDTYTYSTLTPGHVSRLYIGQTDVNGNFFSDSYFGTDALDGFESIIDSYKTDVRNRLVPHTVRLKFSLQDGSSKEFEEVNKLVEDGF